MNPFTPAPLLPPVEQDPPTFNYSWAYGAANRTENNAENAEDADGDDTARRALEGLFWNLLVSALLQLVFTFWQIGSAAWYRGKLG